MRSSEHIDIMQNLDLGHLDDHFWVIWADLIQCYLQPASAESDIPSFETSPPVSCRRTAATSSSAESKTRWPLSTCVSASTFSEIIFYI